MFQIPIIKDLVASASCSRQKYMLYLNEQQEKKKHERKRKLGKKIRSFEEKDEMYGS